MALPQALAAVPFHTNAPHAEQSSCAAADGDEGGRHNLISAVVNKGKLYLCKVQAGDKR